MLFLAIMIVIPIVLVLVVFPLLAYFFLKQPVPPPVEELPLEQFSDKVQQYFLQIIPFLEDEGFHVVCYCEQTKPSTRYFAMLKHANKQDIVVVTSGILSHDGRAWRQYVEFTSELHNAVINTNNDPHQPVFAPQLDDFKRYNFPAVHDLHDLYLLHRALIRHHAKGDAPQIWEDGEELEHFKRTLMRELKSAMQRGDIYLDTALHAYRPTAREAFQDALLTPVEILLFWPFGRLRRWVVNRKTQHILEKIAEARQHVEQEDANSQQFSAEQRRRRREQREKQQQAAFLEAESEPYPILIDEERSSGLLVDIEEKFRDGPVKQAVGLPDWSVCFIFFPIAALLTLVAILAVFSTGNQLLEAKKLEYFGASTLATVLDRRIETIEKDNDGAPYEIHQYYITYRFQAEMGDARRQTSAREEQVTEQKYQRLAVGDDVPVVYDRNNPRISYIKGNYVVFSFLEEEALPLLSFRGLLTLLSLFVGALIGGLATIMLFLWIVTDIKALWLLSAYGKFTTALLLELRRYEHSDAFSDTAEYTVVYRFQVTHASGVITTITGRERVPKDIFNLYRTQKTVDVRYLPARPEWFKLQRWTRKDFRRRL